MRYTRVSLAAIQYELPPNVVTSAALEARLAPVYERLHLPMGQLEALTGIRERRWWNPGQSLVEPTVAAAEKALDDAGLTMRDVGALVYAGVCREQHEPATACAIAHQLGARRDTVVYDLSNACLGVLNGILQLANMVELGQIEAGLVVSCESARDINDAMIAHMLHEPSMERFKLSLATLTGGSGAVAVVVSASGRGHRLEGGVLRAAPEHHDLCRWAADRTDGAPADELMETDAVSVLRHGVALGLETWNAFLPAVGWDGPDKVICHQVGSANRQAVLTAFGVDEDKDFTTYEFLGNIGTVSLPLTAAIADEREFLAPGDRVGFLGIGSGLNCLMLGLTW